MKIGYDGETWERARAGAAILGEGVHNVMVATAKEVSSKYGPQLEITWCEVNGDRTIKEWMPLAKQEGWTQEQAEQAASRLKHLLHVWWPEFGGTEIPDLTGKEAWLQVEEVEKPGGKRVSRVCWWSHSSREFFPRAARKAKPAVAKPANPAELDSDIPF